MDRSSEEALWRAIVENYGERADLDARPAPEADRDTSDPAARPDAGDALAVDRGVTEGPVEAPRDELLDGADHEAARDRESGERAREFEARHEIPDRFVPPEPPPLPYVAPSRLAAWAALMGGPLLLLLSLTVGIPLSGFWQAVAAVAFVGGFVYLVARMPRDPRDPWDDGARV